MNRNFIYTLKILRKIYAKTIGSKVLNKTICDRDPDSASQKIYNALMEDKPCMIARFGSTELTCLVNFLSVKDKKKKYLAYIKGNVQPWWWEPAILKQMQEWSGFFPPSKEKIKQFCNLMLLDMKEVDILGSWLGLESSLKKDMKAIKVHLRLLEPFWAQNPWTTALEDKNILVVHPFAEEITNQYSKRELLFENKKILPEFKSLKVIKAVQSLGEADKRFKDWFEALDFMKNQIDKHNYDYCLIGAGAYGFALAAHVKRSGKKAIHLGGVLQLLFGIIGKRWEDKNYGVKEWGIPSSSYSSLINKHWIRPNFSSKPKFAGKVENACYW